MKVSDKVYFKYEYIIQIEELVHYSIKLNFLKLNV